MPVGRRHSSSPVGSCRIGRSGACSRSLWKPVHTPCAEPRRDCSLKSPFVRACEPGHEGPATAAGLELHRFDWSDRGSGRVGDDARPLDRSTQLTVVFPHAAVFVGTLVLHESVVCAPRPIGTARHVPTVRYAYSLQSGGSFDSDADGGKRSQSGEKVRHRATAPSSCRQ